MNRQDVSYLSSSCAVCNTDTYRPVFLIPPKQIVECHSCGHEYVNPIPLSQHTLDYYFPEGEEYSLGTKIDLHFLASTFARYGIHGGKLLDVGCGQGRLVNGLITSGWNESDLYLMDLSEENLAVAHQKYPQCNIVVGDVRVESGFCDYFDAVIALELLEHLVSPKQAMDNMIRSLKPGGILMLRGLPNNHSLEACLGLDKWRMRQFVDHYQFFNPETFSQFAGQFPHVSLMEFGTFLQEGYQYYDLARFARDVGIIEHSLRITTSAYPSDRELFEQVVQLFEGSRLAQYPHLDRLLTHGSPYGSSITDLELFLNRVSLDYLLAPDFSAVIRKGVA